ncbi:hypothetical protein Tco_0184141 [Tanacetum coccineum]
MITNNNNKTRGRTLDVATPQICHKPTCYECGAQGYFKRDYPKLKNNNRGNQGRNDNALEKVYAIGHAWTNLDSNVITGTFLLKNRYASVLFDTGADKIFTNACKELGIFDVIIGMDWLAKYQAVIVYAKKIIRIPWGNETLIVRGDGSDWGNDTRLNIISCTKMQKYILKGCPVFLAHVTTKETEDQSEKKRLEDVPNGISKLFLKVFP